MTRADRSELQPGDIIRVRYQTGDVIQVMIAEIAGFSPIQEPHERAGFWTPAGVWVGLPAEVRIDRLGS